MKKAILFAVAAADLVKAKLAVESALNAQLNAHESEYRGGEYFRVEHNGTNLVLQQNFEEDDGEPTEAEFPHAEIILYVDGEERDVDVVCATLSTSRCIKELLRSSVY